MLPEEARQIIRDRFPTAKMATQVGIGCEVYTLNFWEFQLSINISTKSLFGVPMGTCQCSCTLLGKPVVKKAAVSSYSELITYLDFVRLHLIDAGEKILSGLGI
jgi:hypothetical protein